MSEIQENLSPDNQQATTLDEDLKRIRDAKYDHGLESEVCGWIGEIIGRRKGPNESAATWMKSGDVLCTLMNSIRPGTIKKYNVNTTSKFKQMENITLFLRACREVGMLEKDLFSTVDLFEAKDMNAVILSLFNLGGTIQSTIPYFTGPKLGIKQANRNFPVVPQLEVPRPPPPPPVVAPIVDPTPVVIERQYFEPAPLPPAPVVMQTAAALPASPAAAISMSTLVKPPPQPVASLDEPPVIVRRPPEVVSTVLSPPIKPAAIQATVASIPSVKVLQHPASPPKANPVLLRDPVSPRETIPSSRRDISLTNVEMDIKPRKRTALSSKQIITSTKSAVQQQPPPVQPPNYLLPQVVMPQMMVHPAAYGTYQSYGSNLLQQVSSNMQRGLMFVPPPRVAAPQRRHFMPTDASEQSLGRAVVEWIEAVVCEGKHPSVSLHSWLGSGEILCKLANVILGASPNPHIRIATIARQTDPANNQRDNARRFVEICRMVGVGDNELFASSDLYEGRDLGRVLRCVAALGGVLQNYEWWVNSPYAQLGKRVRIQSLVKV
jgi:hypothetical protein